jgi:3-keto-5-aminohexanoate cleavage enzyme
VDVPVYPSCPATLRTGTDASSSGADGAARFAHIEALAERGLLEFAVIDPDNVNSHDAERSPRRSRQALV